MSKSELDKIKENSRLFGTDCENTEQIPQKTGKEKLDEIEIKSKKSGTMAGKNNYEKKTVLFEKYEIIVELTSDGKFIGIEEVRINKDFRDYAHRIRHKAFEYIDSYKPE